MKQRALLSLMGVLLWVGCGSASSYEEFQEVQRSQEAALSQHVAQEGGLSELGGRAPGLLSTPIAVDFTDCVETIGVTLVSTAKARALVPSKYILLGEAAPLTPLVMRTERCDGISVNGGSSSAGTLIQIGLMIVPPDFTGNVNNYTLWYYTTHSALAAALQGAGVDAQHVSGITYTCGTGSPGTAVSFSANVPSPGSPSFSLSGSVVESNIPSGPFTANWWEAIPSASVKMTTHIPDTYNGDASITLTTDPNGALGQLIGGGSTGFEVLEQFNTFPTAEMDVTTVTP